MADSAWVAPTPPLSAAGKDASNGDIAVDRDGDVLVAWVRDNKVEAVFRPAGGTFGAPQPVSTGNAPNAPSVAFDPQGGAIMVWTQADGSTRPAYAAYRPDGGAFGTGVPISEPGRFVNAARVFVDSFGNALAAWNQDGPAGLGVAYRPAGGSFGDPAPIGSPNLGDGDFDIAFDDLGNAILIAGEFDTTPGSTSYIKAAYRPVGGDFGALTPVASAQTAAAQPAVAFDGAGNAIAVYLLWDTTVTDSSHYRVGTASRPAGGSFGPSQPVSTTSRDSRQPDVAFGPDGTAVAVWMQGFQPQAAVRPPGGSFGEQKRLSPAIHDSLVGPALAFDAHGTAHVTWSGQDAPGHYAARTATRPAGGSFSDMQTLSGTGVASNDQVLVEVDALGDAVSLWRRSDGTNLRYELAAYDGAPPQIRELTIPSTGTVGEGLAFGVAPLDVWSSVTTTWAFGDGATAGGETVSHAYTKTGKFAPAVTATDALGHAASAGGTVAVMRRSLSLTRVSLFPTRFRAAPRGAALGSSPIGTRVRFRLDRAARMRFRAERARTGRRVGGRCRKATAKNRHNRRCTRYVTVKGSASRAARAGANSVRFRGRLGGRRLSAGRYRLIVRATDGVASATRRLAFRIVTR
jgi:hypothetical protein